MKIKVRIWWMPRDSSDIHKRDCYLVNSNSTIHFAKSRGLNLEMLSISDFNRQGWIFFYEESHLDAFTIRYEGVVSLKVLEIEYDDEN